VRSFLELAVVTLRVFGPLRLHAEHGRDLDTLIRRSKRIALLAYLAAARPRGFHRRDTLLALFWPESDNTRARAALNQAVYVLRSVLGEQAIATRGDGDIGLRDDVIWCDANAFETALDSGRTAEALSLYEGDLLAGFFVVGAPEFERWIVRERDRLRQRAADAAWSLAEEHAAARNVVEAERLARRAAAFLPADEATVRRLMTFLHGLGDRAAARRAYEAFAWELANEYELEPSPETRALAEAVSRDEGTSPRAVVLEGRGDAAGVMSGGATDPITRAKSRGARVAGRLATAALGALVAVSAIGLWLNRPTKPPTYAGNVPRLVVLPFQNLGGDEDEYFANGITDEITGRLAQVSGLRVISRTSAMQYKDRGKPMAQIARELNVDYVLEGTIRTARDAVGKTAIRIIPQLLRVTDDASLWTERYTAGLAAGELFRVQADIAEQVARALNVTLLESERRSIAFRPTENLDAYVYYLRGTDYYRHGFNERDTRLAVAMLERAVDMDNRFAVAYARLAQSHAQMYWFYYDHTARRLAQASQALDRALSLGPDLPEAHLAAGFYHYWGHLAYSRALTAFETAGRHRPNDSEIFEAIGNVRRRQGDFAGAIASFDKALQLDPMSPRVWSLLAATHMLAGDYAAAERNFDKVIGLFPEFALPYHNRARLYLSVNGSTGKARAVLNSPSVPQGDASIQYVAVQVDVFEGAYANALERIASSNREAFENQWQFVPADQLRAEIHQLMGRHDLARPRYDAARAVAEKRVRERPDEAHYHSALGIAYAGLGHKREAIAEARRGVTLLPVTQDAWRGLYRLEDLARVYVMVGEYDAALAELESLVSLPGGRTVPFLALDPAWIPLRHHPRFHALSAASAVRARRSRTASR
jgi:DNA-binding SARP family transcriptional activator/TolB-like protein/Flp pilus assembly protein TadD